MVVNKFYSRCVGRGSDDFHLELASGRRDEGSDRYVEFRGFPIGDEKRLRVVFLFRFHRQRDRFGCLGIRREDRLLAGQVDEERACKRNRSCHLDRFDEDGCILLLFPRVRDVEFRHGQQVLHPDAEIRGAGHVLRLADHRHGFACEVGGVTVAGLDLGGGEVQRNVFG